MAWIRLGTSCLVRLRVNLGRSAATFCKTVRPMSAWRHGDIPIRPRAVLLSGSLFLRTAAVTAAATVASIPTAADCDEDDPGDVHVDNSPEGVKARNPLWPEGVSQQMIEDYVDAILQNEDINIRAIPDSIERIIYVSTVRLTLNAVYKWLSYLHGIRFLGHHLELVRNSTHQDAAAGLDFTHNSGKIDQASLEDMANELLANKSINQWWIPDHVERQVYTNCLKLVFCLLDKIADTLSIRLCGHELSLSFEPSSLVNASTASAALDAARGGCPPTRDPKITVDPAYLKLLVDEAIQGSKDSSKFSVWMLVPLYGQFINGLHTTLYSLVLGIVDDLLHKTELNVLSERITINLIADGDVQSRAEDGETPRRARRNEEMDRVHSTSENQELRNQIALLSSELQTLRSVPAPDFTPSAGWVSATDLDASGGASAAMHQKLVQFRNDLKNSQRRERVSNLATFLTVMIALAWHPLAACISSCASYILARMPISTSSA